MFGGKLVKRLLVKGKLVKEKLVKRLFAIIGKLAKGTQVEKIGKLANRKIYQRKTGQTSLTCV